MGNNKRKRTKPPHFNNFFKVKRFIQKSRKMSKAHPPELKKYMDKKIHLNTDTAINSFGTATHSSSKLSLTTASVSDRSVLPAGRKGQGAAVEVYSEETVNENMPSLPQQPNVTSSGHQRYRGLKHQN